MVSCDVIGIGENSIDYVYRLPSHPMPNTASAKMRVSSYRVSPGGQVATTLATCAALGLKAKYAGVFGGDDPGRRVREALEARGVDTRDAIVRDAPTRHAVILVDERQGDRVVLWERDPALDLLQDEISSAVIGSARVLHVDDTDVEGALAAAAIAVAAGVTVTSDIDRVTSRTTNLLRAVTIPIFSEHVPRELTGEDDPERALRALGQRHDGWLCVTLGARGSMLLERNRLYHAPAFAVNVTDTTGAGDVFRGAFIYALLRGDGPEAILRFANAAAAAGCTRVGALESVPSRADVDNIVAGTKTL